MEKWGALGWWGEWFEGAVRPGFWEAGVVEVADLAEVTLFEYPSFFGKGMGDVGGVRSFEEGFVVG